MRVRFVRRQARGAFTLVELLTVIIIIGILVSLITAAAIRARLTAKIASVRIDISQLEMALEAYKDKYGEYPPDFSLVNDASCRDYARGAVVRHLRMAFPRYQPLPQFSTLPPDQALWETFRWDLTGGYGIEPAQLDPASALVFWLGGLPELRPLAGQKWIPAGFHADPAHPFRPGQPRTQRLFDFIADHLPAWDNRYPGKPILGYFPPHIEGAPYVYFRARLKEYGYQVGPPVGFVQPYYQPAAGNVCVPYLEDDSAVPRPWYHREKFQIITAGMDGIFGSWDRLTPRKIVAGGVSGEDLDNVSNCAQGRLEDEMAK